MNKIIKSELVIPFNFYINKDLHKIYYDIAKSLIKQLSIEKGECLKNTIKKVENGSNIEYCIE